MAEYTNSIDYFYYGLGTNINEKVYGLWSHGKNCFILINRELKVLQKTAELISSKIDVRIIDLTVADNYELNIIDNIVCENWMPQFDITKELDDLELSVYTVVYVKSLKNSFISEEDKKPITEIKKWAQMISFWCTVLQRCKEYRRFDAFPRAYMQYYLDIPDFHDSAHILEQKIYKELYLGLDLNLVTEKILLLSQQDKRLYTATQKGLRWLKEQQK